MAYTPLAQLEKEKKTGYVPIGNGSIPSPLSTPVFLTDPFGGATQTSTPQFKEGGFSAGTFAKEVGQSIASNIASAGLTVASKLAPTELKPYVGSLKSSDFQSFLAQGAFETIFGKDKEIKSIEDRIADVEPKVKQWGLDLEKVSQTPGLSPTQRIVTQTLSQMAQQTTSLFGVKVNPITFFGIMGSVGLDLSPFGGLEKNVYKTFVKTASKPEAISVLTRMGISADLAASYADDVVRVATEADAEKLFKSIANMQATTKAAPSVIKTSKEISVEKITKDIIKDFYKTKKTPTLGDVFVSAKTGERVEITKVGESSVEYFLAGKKKGIQGTIYFDEPIKQVVKESPRQKAITQATEVSYKQLDEIAQSIKRKDVTAQEFEQIQMRIDTVEDTINSMPGRQLVKFISKKEGEFLDFKDPLKAKSPLVRAKITEKNERILKASEKAFEGTELSRHYDDPDVIRDAIAEYKEVKAELNALKAEAKNIRLEKSAVKKGEYLMQMAKGDRRTAYNSLKDAFALSDTELAKIRGGKDIMAMTPDEFKDFMRIAEGRAAQMAERSEARVQLEATIFEKELKNWENVREAMQLPEIPKMTTGDMKKLEEVLSKYQTGDTFLTTRQLETIDATTLAGIRTEREALEHLAKKTGLTRAEVSAYIKPHPFMYDTQLARQEPFYKLLVDNYNQSYLRATEKTINLEKESNRLITAARKSRQRSIWEKLIPTDSRITEYREAPLEMKVVLAKDMTPEELRAAKFYDKYFKETYDWMLGRELNNKFTSRFEDTYYPHVRRGFLEAWKEDGFTQGVKEWTRQVKQDEKLMTILNEKTGEVLPYQKWIGFEQFRTGELIPSKNMAFAFKRYVTAIEKARQYDEFIPEMMVYAHTLTPKGLTDRGIELNDTIQRFFKEWINSKKGRIKGVVMQPGSKADWALRTGVALTRVRDLGLNLGTQLAALAGEQVGNVIMLRQKYPIGVARLATKQGRAIVSKYENFVGKGIYEKFIEASNDVGDKLMIGLMGIFGEASRQSNATFLLSMMTKDEFTKGVISTERLAFLRNKMGKYRVVEHSESLMGRSAEAALLKQHKRWAIPIIISTIDNLKDATKMVAKGELRNAAKSEQTAELLTGALLTGAIALGSNAYYTELKNKKDRSTVEDMAFKVTREALSLIGALDPRFIVGFATPRLVSFLEDLTNAMTSIVKLEEYKTGKQKGELKGVEQLKRTLEPVVVKSLRKTFEDTPSSGSVKSSVLDKYQTGGSKYESVLDKYR